MDTLSIVQAIVEDSFEISNFGHLLHDILVLANRLKVMSFPHTYRQGNSVAHTLAKSLRVTNLVRFGSGIIPLFILSFYDVRVCIHSPLE